MKKKILFVAAVLIGSQLLAQQDSTHQLLEEIVVTASKYPKKISETGKVLTVITPAQLERSSGKDLSQLLNEQAGLIINGSSSNPGKDKNIFLQGAIGKYSLILLDGVPVNDASGAGGAFDLRLLSIAEVERIEILKGSQSTLYGSDAIAGVINIITKKGGKKPLSANGLVSYGSWNSFKTNAGINGRVNWFDYNLGYAYTGTDGISEASDEKNNTGIGFDRDGYKQHALQASLGIQVSKLLRLNPFIRYNRFKGQYDDDAFTDGRDTNLSKFLNTGMQAVYQLSKGSLNANYAFEQTDRRFAGTYGTYQFKGQFNNAEIFFHYDLTKMLQLLAGLNYQDLKMLDTAASKKNPSVHFTSPYASLFLHNLGGFYLELGGRYNSHSQYGNNFTYSLNPSYLFAKRVKLFFNYSTGFKAPTLSELYGQFGHNENLKPEESNSIESGIQFLPANKISARVTFFKRDIKDAIVYTFAGGYINQNRQKDHGIETEASVDLFKDLSLRAFYAFVDGKITDKTTTGKDTVYFNLIRRPKHSFGLSLGYQVTSELYLSTHLSAYSKRVDLFYNPANFYAAEEVKLQSYVLLDLYAEYKLWKDKLKLFADAKNITNSRYTEVYGYSTPGFNVIGGLSIKL